MHKTTSWARRASLDADQLHQLLVALRDDVDRYRVAIRGYTEDKMSRFGTPYLAKLEVQVAEIEGLIVAKTNGH